MNWKKIDHYTREPIKEGGWHIVNYISGRFEIAPNGNKWSLFCNQREVGTFKTLKAAKERATEIEPLSEWI